MKPQQIDNTYISSNDVLTWLYTNLGYELFRAIESGNDGSLETVKRLANSFIEQIDTELEGYTEDEETINFMEYAPFLNKFVKEAYNLDMAPGEFIDMIISTRDNQLA